MTTATSVRMRPLQRSALNDCCTAEQSCHCAVIPNMTRDASGVLPADYACIQDRLRSFIFSQTCRHSRCGFTPFLGPHEQRKPSKEQKQAAHANPEELKVMHERSTASDARMPRGPMLVLGQQIYIASSLAS